MQSPANDATKTRVSRGCLSTVSWMISAEISSLRDNGDTSVEVQEPQTNSPLLLIPIDCCVLIGAESRREVFHVFERQYPTRSISIKRSAS